MQHNKHTRRKINKVRRRETKEQSKSIEDICKDNYFIIGKPFKHSGITLYYLKSLVENIICSHTSLSLTFYAFVQRLEAL